MKKEELTKQREELVTSLDNLIKQEQKLDKELETTRANINATQGALQYHDYLVNKMDLSKEEKPVELTEAEEVK
jgi:pantothenate kinase